MKYFLSLLLLTHAALAQPRYTLVIDAGSTGSRAHLYQVTRAQPHAIIKEIASKKITPGISADPTHPDKAAQQITSLVQSILSQVPSATPRTIPAAVLSTAGMRLISSSARDAINQTIRHSLQQHFHFTTLTVKTIPGWEEAIYDWLTVAYLTHHLTPSTYHQVGILDLGGGSTEIAIPSSTSLWDGHVVQIQNKRYFLYAKSYLPLGLKVDNALLNHSTHAAACYPEGLPLPSLSTTGRYHAPTCTAFTEQLIAHAHVHPIYYHLPMWQGSHLTLYALSGFFYTTKMLALPANQLRRVQALTQQICQHQSWTQLQLTHPNTPEKYLKNLCFNGHFVHALLYGRYGLELGKQSVITAHTLANTDLDWTLGAALYQVSGHGLR